MIATRRFPLLRRLALGIVFGATLGAVEPARLDAARALFHQRGKSAEAQQAFESIAAEDPRNHAAQYHLGLLAYRRDDMDACVAYLERAIALAPNDGASHKALGDAYGRTAQKASIFRQLGWAKKCLAAYQRAVALAPDQAEFRQCLFEYYFQAPGFAGGGRDKAVAEAAAIKRLDPHAGRLAFARIAIDDRKYADAFAQFDEVLAHTPDDYLALYEIGRIAALTGREADRGIRSLRRCLEPTPPAAPGASATPPANGANAAAAPARPPAPAPGQPPAFAEVTKDAKQADGFLPVWTKDDKTWLEIPAAQLDKPMFFGNSLAGGLGERSFWPGLMGSEYVVVFRRVGNNVQMVARNMHARGPAADTPLGRAIGESYSDSLLAAVPLAAAPHPDRKSLLVDAMALLGGDLPKAQTLLEMMYRMPYGLDRGNSSITAARTKAEGTSITVRAHFAVPKLPAPPVFGPGSPPPNPAMMPNPPTVVPDARSFFLSFAYTLAPLPEVPMAARRADQRVGYFTDGYMDFSSERGGERRTHVINRWRLEKQDPAAEVSPPKQPIRVVMDRNIPEKWREPVKAGILEWNKAFERAGFRDAIALEQQPADADWSTFEGTRMLAVRWFAMEGPGATAVGPSQADPRTGEILRGAAIIPENWVRLGHTRIAETLPRLAGQGSQAGDGHDAAAWSQAMPLPGEFAPRLMACTFASDALAQASFGYELLIARGQIEPGSPEGDKFIADSLKDVVMHEVGHALGLRHNFRGSTGITRAQLRDPGFTAQRGLSNSIMDYNALNLPLEGEASSTVQQGVLGAYDYWAIEYGYRQYTPEQEAKALAELAARGATDRNLAYATDEDADNTDPLVNRFDLGDDPLAFAARQMKLARELWQRTAARQLSPDDDMSLYRRNLQRTLANVAGATPIALRHVGGIVTSRATAGAGQPLYQPLAAARQREALDLVLGQVFASQSFRFEPALMSRLGVDQFERLGPNRFITNTDFSLGDAVLRIQRGALDTLMGDGLAQRLADAEVKVSDPKALMSYAEVQQRLGSAVWSELKGGARAGGEIDSLRRNLQREHLKRLAGGLLRPASGVAADVRAVHRVAAQQLEAELRAALAQPGWSAMARAHLAESQATLAEALKAPLMRQGV